MKFALTSIAVALALVGCANGSSSSSTTPAVASKSVINTTIRKNTNSAESTNPNANVANGNIRPIEEKDTSEIVKTPPDFSVDNFSKEKEQELAKTSSPFGVVYIAQSDINEAAQYNAKVEAGPPESASEEEKKAWPKIKKNASVYQTKTDNGSLEKLILSKDTAKLDIGLVVGAGANGITPANGQDSKAIDKDSDGIQKYIFEDLKFARYGYAANPFDVSDASKGGMFAQGQVTHINQIPLKGTATYAGQALYRTDARKINHQGNSEFTADFFHKELTGKVSAGKYKKDIFAHIQGNRFEYTPTEKDVNERPAVSGMFFGENYAELAGVFHDAGQNASGSFGAKRTDNATNTDTSANTGTTPKP